MQTRIENWRKHLKQMRNGYYEVNGSIGRVIRYRFVGNTHIKIDLSTGSFEWSVEETPYKLATWRPINEDGKVSYDHIAAEQQLQVMRPDVPTVDAEEVHEVPVLNDAPTQEHAAMGAESLEQTIEDSYKQILAAMITNASFTHKKLQETMMLLKGERGAEHVQRAQQIIGAVKAGKAVNDSLIGAIRTGMEFVKELNKPTKAE